MATTIAEPTLVIVAVIQTTDQAARDKLISLFENVVEYSKEKEPGVLKYAICVPSEDPKDLTTIYAIEEYTNQKAYKDHMNTEPVKELLAVFSGTAESPSLAAKEPVIHSLHWTSAVFTRPKELYAHPNPYILWATIDTVSLAHTLEIAPYGAAVVDFARDNEPNTLFYGDARTNVRREDDAGFIAAVEIYTDKAALLHHYQGHALQAMVGESKKLGGTLTTVGLTKVKGWLIREEATQVEIQLE